MSSSFRSRSKLELPAEGPDGNDRDGAPVVIAMGAAAVSGFVMGLLVRGDFATSGFVFVAACVCGVIGWCARGVR